jgi:hypothetical protein
VSERACKIFLERNLGADAFEVTLEEVNNAQGVEKPTFLLNHVKEIQL